MTTRVFALPERLAGKADPALVAGDEEHFAAIERSLDDAVATLEEQLDAARRAPGRIGQEAMDRDLEVHRLAARLRTLRRYSLDLCLGRIVPSGTGEAVYVGRLGLSDRDGRRLLVDWRSPAAEPFFAATYARPMGLASRRRYRWTRGRITDYWDEAFTPEGREHAALDDDSAFLASLGSSRSPRMRDVLGTLQADQDAIIRAGSRGALVVDGGPGTGKTVVALHRAAYLLYADPRVGQHHDHRHGGVLVVGPHQPWLAYVADVLPSLGEEGVLTCTVADLVPEGAVARPDPDPEVTRLKSSARMAADAIEAAVAFYEEPPTTGSEVETEVGDLWLSAADWADAFASPAPGTPHNEARDEVWEELLTILADKHEPSDPDDDEEREAVRRSLERNRDLREAFDRAWPLVEATDLVGDLWEVPAYLRRCAPWLTADERARLRRDDPQAWTTADLPLLDAARMRLGDPEASRRRRRREVALAAEQARMDLVVDELLHHDEEGMLAQLRQDGVRAALLDEDAAPANDADRLAGPFAHVVVDEAQELTDAEWQVLLRRCPSRSFTVVGDRAQARQGFPETWAERLQRVGFDVVEQATLTVNYRTPAEVMAEAAPVIRSVLPDANVPASIRSTGVPVLHAPVSDRDAIMEAWLREHDEGTACVIGDPSYAGSERVRSLTPVLAKGLEFDLVVLVDPDAFGDGVAGGVDRYVAMTRATQQLVVLGPTLVR